MPALVPDSGDATAPASTIDLNADLGEEVTDDVALLAVGEDASFQNKVHAMAGRGWDAVKTLGSRN